MCVSARVSAAGFGMPILRGHVRMICGMAFDVPNTHIEYLSLDYQFNYNHGVI